MRRKEERSKQGQTNNKAKQHSTPKAVTFPKKNELPRVGLECTAQTSLDHYSQTTYTVLEGFWGSPFDRELASLVRDVHVHTLSHAEIRYLKRLIITQ